jgi:hypothetical protein
MSSFCEGCLLDCFSVSLLETVTQRAESRELSFRRIRIPGQENPAASLAVRRLESTPTCQREGLFPASVAKLTRSQNALSYYM